MNELRALLICGRVGSQAPPNRSMRSLMQDISFHRLPIKGESPSLSPTQALPPGRVSHRLTDVPRVTRCE